MKVLVNKNVYQMDKKMFLNLIKIARESIKKGIVAIEKGDIAEMRKDTFDSKTKFKKQVKEFQSQGYKVHTNWES